MVVRATGDEAEALLLKLVRQRFRVCEDAALVATEVLAQSLAEGDGLRGDDVNERAALHAWEEFLINFGGVLRLAKYESAARAAQGLVRRRRHVVGVRDGRRVEAGGDRAGDVRDVGHDARAHAPRDLADALEVNYARVGRRAADDELRVMLLRDALQHVVVNLLGLARDAVVGDLVAEAGEVQGVSVREVAAVRKVHAEYLVAVRERGQGD